MADYIDRTALLAELALNDYPWSDLDDAYNAIQKMPAADVAPVVHGKWEFPIFSDGNLNDPRCKCSECGSIETPLARHKFCPNCGAKMDEGD